MPISSMLKRGLSFLGRNLGNNLLILFLIVSTTIVTAQTYSKIGDVLAAGDQNVKIIDIGSSDIHVDVNGQRGTVTLNETKLINGANVALKDIFYHISPGSRLAWVEVAFVYSTKDLCTVNTECDDGNPCTLDRCTGNPKKCSYPDSHFLITYCLSGDNCCNADFCGAREDSDCAAEPACQVDTDCMEDRDKSTRAVCKNNLCVQEKITVCIGGDDYCPDGCYHSITSDQDCKIDNKCVRNTDCDDSNPCTTDLGCLENEQGIKECVRKSVTECKTGDRCCPEGCSYLQDTECPASGEINTQTGGTPANACSRDSDCGQGKCVDNRCDFTQVVEQLEETGSGFFAKIISFLKKLFLPTL